jgi:DNA repair exonuclease SbcCD ATPase subunit
MNFLDFLRSKENKRRRAKRITINLIYLLIPVVLIATNYSNNRIISECEVIHEEYVSCQKEVDRLRDGQPIEDNDQELQELRDVLEQLQEENKRLEDINAGLSQGDTDLSDVIEELNRKIRDIESNLRQCERERNRLAQDNERLRNRPQPDAPDCKDQIEEIENQRDECERRRKALYEQNQDLQRQLQDCDTKGYTIPEIRKYILGSRPIKMDAIPDDQQSNAIYMGNGQALRIVIDGQVVAYVACD